jgi:hypothetical protein
MSSNGDQIDASLANLGFSNFLGEGASSMMSGGSQFSLKSLEPAGNDCSFFNSDQLIKFASAVDAGSESEPVKKMELFGEAQDVSIDKVDSLNFNFSFNEKTLGKDLVEGAQDDKKHISPSESPHHEFSCSLSSSDSGCRSTASFLAEEDSGNLFLFFEHLLS